MIELISEFSDSRLVEAARPLAELFGIVIAILALLVAVRAMRLAKGAEHSNLRIKARECATRAKSSYGNLEEATILKRRSWESSKNPTILSWHQFDVPEEIKRNHEIKLEAKKLLDGLVQRNLTLSELESRALERFISDALQVSEKIDEFALRLETPGVFN